MEHMTLDAMAFEKYKSTVPGTLVEIDERIFLPVAVFGKLVLSLLQ